MRRAGATLLYVTTALVMGALELALLISGWTICAVLVITPLIVPALIGFQAAVAYVAGAEAWLARGLVGASAQPAFPALTTGRGYWRRGWDAARDPAFYRQQIFMVGRWLVGGAIALTEWALIATGLFAITLPITYRWLDGPNIGDWKLHTLTQSLIGIPLGIIVLVVAIWLLRPLESLSCWAADDLLGGGGPGIAPESIPEPDAPIPPTSERQRFAMATVTCAGIDGVVLLIWLFTGAGTFWPGWVLISLGVPLAYWGWSILLRERPEMAAKLHMSPKMARIVGRGVALSLYCFLVWLLSGANSTFWPVWVFLVVIARIVVAVVIEINESIRRGPLAERITELEVTRAGAVNQQEAELRRIERDLHDGAQARLVALGMSLGMAQQKLDSDPEAARELLADARTGAQEALQELRDLARGIHPPVLADRGLEAAIAALADRTPLRVTVGVQLPTRPAPAVETATYFVIAEALANAAKHAEATMVDIAVGQVGSTLIAEIRDDGVGGANAGGGGLSGLARRVQALDGTLTVTSPAGGPTLIRAVMPCGS